ncbi:ABC transporter ATP-binding protein [Halocatena halophila]|uniref:ABC transporter ATP-binding protein n=1 Tax=Halocatena halophila TaxID=2814576 RepID=UPI002ED0C7AD
MAAIELHGVTKRFGSVRALDDLELTVPEGEIYGFLGPNGAGKSTTIDVLLDFVRPTAGRATVLGHDAQSESRAIRSRVGVLPDGYHVYDRLTGRQHVQFAMDSKGIDGEPAPVLERVGLTEAIDRRAGGYSKGMAQRLVLGMALVGKPDLLILDEPSTGLDPAGARRMREIIREEAARGAAVFFSSHILGQVDAVCDRVGILRDGRLVAEDTPQNLRSSIGFQSKMVVHVDRTPSDIRQRLSALQGVTDVAVADGTITVESADDSKSAVLTTIEESGVAVEDFTTESASLEDLFMAYTKDTPEVPA